MANKILQQQETAIVWADTGGDYALDLGGLAADAVRAGGQGDLGAAPRSRRYLWSLVVDGFDTPPVIGQTVNAYLSFSFDGTNRDGDVSGTDGAGTKPSLRNLLYLGAAVVQTVAAADELIVSGVVEIPSRYVIPVVHNSTADALLSSADSHRFTLIPIPDEVQ